MKTQLIGALQMAGVVAFVALAIWFSREDRGNGNGAVGLAAGAAEAARPTVKVIMPESVSRSADVHATGSVNVRNYVSLAPQVSGRVTWISPNLNVGGAFAAGERLLSIAGEDFQLALQQAQADLASAQANLRLQRAESDAARANWRLLHGDEPVPPLVAKQPQIAQREAQVAAATARVAVAELEASRATFSLPFAGRVTRSTAEIGQLLNKGQTFGEAFALDAIEVTVPIAMPDLQRIEPAIQRSAVVSAHGASVAAKVDRVAAELNDTTRFGQLFLTFDGAPPFAPGTFVDVVLHGPELAGVFELPEATQQAGGDLWVVRDGKLTRQTPQVHGQTGRRLLVAGFDAAQGVVVGTVPGAREGLPVTTASGSE